MRLARSGRDFAVMAFFGGGVMQMVVKMIDTGGRH